MNEGLPCGGSVEYTADGEYVRRFGCEVHLFDPGTCEWERIMHEERKQARSESRTL